MTSRRKGRGRGGKEVGQSVDDGQGDDEEVDDHDNDHDDDDGEGDMDDSEESTSPDHHNNNTIDGDDNHHHNHHNDHSHSHSHSNNNDLTGTSGHSHTTNSAQQSRLGELASKLDFLDGELRRRVTELVEAGQRISELESRLTDNHTALQVKTIGPTL